MVIMGLTDQQIALLIFNEYMDRISEPEHPEVIRSTVPSDDVEFDCDSSGTLEKITLPSPDSYNRDVIKNAANKLAQISDSDCEKEKVENLIENLDGPIRHNMSVDKLIDFTTKLIKKMTDEEAYSIFMAATLKLKLRFGTHAIWPLKEVGTHLFSKGAKKLHNNSGGTAV